MVEKKWTGEKKKWIGLRAQWLGQHLKQVREDANLSLSDVGDFINRNASTVSRMESGTIPARVTDVLAYLDIAGVDDPNRRDMLKQLSQDIWQKGWWDGFVEDVAATLINRAWIESRVDTMYSYQLVVPGLLQTRGYAEADIRAGDPQQTEEWIARSVEIRMTRQEKILHEREAVRMHMIIDEIALRRPIGGGAAMQTQLDHLLELGKLPTIEIQVLPAAVGAHAGMRGPFEILELVTPYPAIGYVEGQAGAVFLEGEHVLKLRERYDLLRRVSLSHDESVAWISAARADL